MGSPESLALMRRAYHEAGHAVIACRLGWHIKSIKIFSEAVSLGGGVNAQFPTPNFRAATITAARARFIAFQRRQIMVRAGGMIAEELYLPDGSSVTPSIQQLYLWWDDFYRIFGYAEDPHWRAKEPLSNIRQCLDRTRALLASQTNAQAIRRLVDALLENNSLSGQDTVDLIRQTPYRHKHRQHVHLPAPTEQDRLDTLKRAADVVERIMATVEANPGRDVDIMIPGDHEAEQIITIPAGYFDDPGAQMRHYNPIE